VACQANATAGSGLEGVLDEIRDRAPEQSRIAWEIGRCRRIDLRLEVDPLLSAIAVTCSEFFEEVAQIDGFLVNLPE